MTLFLISVTAYLVGSIPILAFFRGKPLVGIYPVRNLREALIIIGMQMSKGALVTLMGLMVSGWIGAAFAAVAVVLGDLFPVFSRFQGGTGVAVTAGALAILSPLLILLGVGIYLITLLLTRYLSLSLVLSAVGVMLLTLVLFPKLYVVLVVFFVGVLILFRQRGLFRRWRRGREAPIRGWHGLRRWK
ncbi:glycerol-3-phosphate acyltransferase [Melghirimyces algeriensis]|uniref:Acyl-phosphate glycerol 3-phosphate acyltransferase n=1 Tax=Melghirimyces algeriensis TaxID=910412 RepID=A0A521DPC5_9BACL|nr:glycerol-3-phosphate acyltransferase [Melghirimyces algeriensis]SMO73543.1 acyl-phosphate glycerol 3-phosphate acyltransferase [Melghirimyces algeriensis]